MNTIRMAFRQIGKFLNDCALLVEQEKRAEAHRLQMRQTIANSQAQREAEQEACPHTNETQQDRSVMVWIPDGKYLICQHCQVMKKQDWPKFGWHLNQSMIVKTDFFDRRKSKDTKAKRAALDAAYKMPLTQVFKLASAQRMGPHQ